MIDRRRLLLAAMCGSSAALLKPSGSNELVAADDLLVHDQVAAMMGQVELSMRFRGETAKEFGAWQTRFRAKLNELLGDSSPPKKWTAEEEGREQFDDHTRYDLLLHSDEAPTLPVYLLVPRKVSENRRGPAVLCVHGHGQYGNHTVAGRTDLPGVAENIKTANYDYGRQFVQRGYVVAAPCMIPFGRRVDRERYGGNDPCAVTFVRMMAAGRLPITANLRDLRWSLDLLQSRPEVRRDALGCAGLSYGGRMTMMVSAIDQRIRVAAVSGALNLLQERMTLRHSCGSQLIPRLLEYGDYSEIGSLLAPRPCVWEVGSKDGLIVEKWDDVFRERLAKAYQAAGKHDNLYFDNFDGGHQWSGRIAFPLFDKVLKT